jgi:ElaA protein
MGMAEREVSCAVAEDPAWRYGAWATLTRDELYRILALRQRVFVVEQSCPYLDADGWDDKAHHLWSDDAGGATCVAYLRVFAPGVKYDEASLGRIVTAPEVRRAGLGRPLIREGLARIAAAHGPVPVRIGAQKYLEAFYGGLGFVRASDDYDEDGIPHLEMVRR